MTHSGDQPQVQGRGAHDARVGRPADDGGMPFPGVPAAAPAHVEAPYPAGPHAPGPVAPGTYPAAPGPQGPWRPALRPQDLLEGREKRLWRLPAVPVEYQHMLRGRGYAVWKPLLSLLLIGVVFLGGQLAMGVVIAVRTFASNPDLVTSPSADPSVFMEALDFNDPLNLLALLLGIIVLIPTCLAGVRFIHGIPAGYLSSVAGRFRWRWAARCLAVILPLWLASVAIEYGIRAALGEPLAVDPPENWPVLLVIVVLLVPFQAAAEEYAFRGYAVQAMGSWFPHRWAALVVPSAVSVSLFALAHGSFDPLTLFFLVLFAASATYLTWRTGGLEAAVVLHAVNNVVVFLVTMIEGDVSTGLIGVSDAPDPGLLEALVAVGSQLLLFGLALLGVVLLARRGGVQRRFEPVPVALPVVGGPPAPAPWEPASAPSAISPPEAPRD